MNLPPSLNRWPLKWRELFEERAGIMEFFVDETAPNVESQGLSLMRKHVRVWLPQIRGLLSYSDPTEGHEGTIYDADMWCPLGLTDEAWGYGWKSREGRREQKISRKMRWFRTP